MPDEPGVNPPARRSFHPDLEVPAVPAEPVAEPVEPTTPTVEPPEAPEVDTVFVGGREQTVEEALVNYQKSSDEAVRLQAEVKFLREQAAIAVQAPPVAPEPAPVPIVPLDFDTASPSEIQTWVAQTAAAEAKAIASTEIAAQTKQFNDFIQGFSNLNAAQAEMKKIDPAYDPAKLDAFLTSDPAVQERYNRMFQADQLGAIDFAWSKMPKDTEPDPSRDVQQPSRRRKPAPTTVDAAKRLEAARDEAEATGIWEPYFRLRAVGTSMTRAELKAPQVGRPLG